MNRYERWQAANMGAGFWLVGDVIAVPDIPAGMKICFPGELPEAVYTRTDEPVESNWPLRDANGNAVCFLVSDEHAIVAEDFHR